MAYALPQVQGKQSEQCSKAWQTACSESDIKGSVASFRFSETEKRWQVTTAGAADHESFCNLFVKVLNLSLQIQWIYAKTFSLQVIHRSSVVKTVGSVDVWIIVSWWRLFALNFSRYFSYKQYPNIHGFKHSHIHTCSRQMYLTVNQLIYTKIELKKVEVT